MRNLLVKFLVWRIKYLSDKNFLVLLAIVIGIIAGLASVVLKETVHYIQKILTGDFEIQYANYFYIFFPLIGLILTLVIAKYLLKERLGHGISEILYIISKKSSLIPRSRTFSRMITSAFTVGFGGSVGLEAPIVVTGSAIGSNVGRLVHMNYKQRTILIACGAAAAISGIFNSPVAGVVFALEVLLSDITIAAFIPILIASVFGSLVSQVLLGDDILFSFKLTDPFHASDVPFYILLGIAAGITSVHFTRFTYIVEKWISGVPNDFRRVIVGGVLLGLIIFVFPPIYGEGYDTIKLLLSGREQEVLDSTLFFNQIDNYLFIILFMFLVAFIKPAASALTIGSGGSGGIFAPSLFIGGVAGFVFATFCNTFFGFDISVKNFVLVGMCGAMSGILHAPLTAIFLIAEITSGYTLFIPLMLVSAISYTVTSYFESYSLYTKHLILQGDLIQDDKDRQVLSLIPVKKLIEKDLLTIMPEAKLNQLVELVRKSNRNIFPVVNSDNELVGVVTLDDIRQIMFDPDSQENVLVETLMHDPPAHVSSHENMQSVMNKFEVTGAWNLPVIDDGKYVGFLSKSRIFNSYRTKLKRTGKKV